jgi:hypothetical protein
VVREESGATGLLYFDSVRIKKSDYTWHTKGRSETLKKPVAPVGLQGHCQASS